MVRSIKIGSEFINMNRPKMHPHLTNIYWGSTDGTNRHGHIVTSGSVILGNVISAETWYARDTKNNELIKNGSVLIENAPKLLSDSIPETLKEIQHPENQFFWHVESLNSFFTSFRKSN